MIAAVAPVILGLGGNLGEPAEVFRTVLGTLAGECRLGAVSRLWRTRAVGPPQPDYLNAAAVVLWPAALRTLLERCRGFESAAGRDRSRGQRWGPRTLDLDLLLADGVVCRGPTLTVPHPRLHERRFALEPAAEVAPDWVHPLYGQTISELAAVQRGRDPDAVLEVLSFEL
jgi:2-amino-4-hydroxy-6-hydroxymethyldihydropteridine diphosphokinase